MKYRAKSQASSIAERETRSVHAPPLGDQASPIHFRSWPIAVVAV